MEDCHSYGFGYKLLEVNKGIRIGVYLFERCLQVVPWRGIVRLSYRPQTVPWSNARTASPKIVADADLSFPPRLNLAHLHGRSTLAWRVFRTEMFWRKIDWQNNSESYKKTRQASQETEKTSRNQIVQSHTVEDGGLKGIKSFDIVPLCPICYAIEKVITYPGTISQTANPVNPTRPLVSHGLSVKQ
jgi:hypothetical protein